MIVCFVAGNIVGGIPLSYAANAFDWFTVFTGVNIIGMITFLILVFGKDIRANYIQQNGGPGRIIKE